MRPCGGGREKGGTANIRFFLENKPRRFKAHVWGQVPPHPPMLETQSGVDVLVAQKNLLAQGRTHRITWEKRRHEHTGELNQKNQLIYRDSDSEVTATFTVGCIESGLKMGGMGESWNS